MHVLVLFISRALTPFLALRSHTHTHAKCHSTLFYFHPHGDGDGDGADWNGAVNWNEYSNIQIKTIRVDILQRTKKSAHNYSTWLKYFMIRTKPKSAIENKQCIIYFHFFIFCRVLHFYIDTMNVHRMNLARIILYRSKLLPLIFLFLRLIEIN